MTIQELKAAAYDAMAAIEFHRARLVEINKAIAQASKEQEEKKPEAQ